MGTNLITYQKNSDTPNVEFYSVPASNSGNSGNPGEGTVTVGNVYYNWNSAEGGFTDTGWWGTSVSNGPTRMGGFNTDDAVADFLSNSANNLNSAFQEWQNYIDSQPVWEQAGIIDDFNQALLVAGNGNGRNCMTEV